MSVANLLVELCVEELPPKALKRLGDAFAVVLLEQLRERGLASEDSELASFASPRRLAAHITSVRAQAPDKEIIQKLVPVSVGLKDGKPTDALRKRLAKEGRERLADLWPDAQDGSDKLFVQSDGKVEAIYLRGLATGSSLQVGLEFAVNEAIAKLPIPKVMTYQLADGWSDVKFVRPAHSLVALHGSDVVPIEVLGLSAGRTTHGHRFEAAVDPVQVKDADSYAATLQSDGSVIASFDARKQEIREQLVARAPEGCFPLRDPDGSIDDALLEEVTALVERPNVLLCEFEKEFLQVPQECLILTMKANQKYFPLLDAQGRLTNRFLVVSNIRPADASAVIGGNERVVRPRLADAKFFFDQDRKKTLESRVAGLAKVVYHNKLGTQGERVERVRAIAKSIAAILGNDVLARQADTAAKLAKADLLTDMVGEFPELQGIMGGYYARHDGLGEDVAFAIEDHYRPRFSGDALPRNEVGIVVALADKFETLVGLFGIGQVPTGDKDPFALRRHALGIIRLLMERNLPLDLQTLVEIAYGAIDSETIQQEFAKRQFDEELARRQQANPSGFTSLGAAHSRRQLEPGAVGRVTDFVYERLAGALREQGYSAQEVDAVLALRPQRLGDIPKRLAAVRAFAALPEAPALAAANKRIGNILKKAERADAHVAENLLKEEAEKALYAATQKIAPQARKQFDAGDYTASLQTLAALRGPVDAFFDDVMVNTEEADLRLNRLGLLATLHQAMNRVADLSRLAT